MANGDASGNRGDRQRAIRRLASLDVAIAHYKGDVAGLGDLKWQSVVEASRSRLAACSS